MGVACVRRPMARSAMRMAGVLISLGDSKESEQCYRCREYHIDAANCISAISTE